MHKAYRPPYSAKTPAKKPRKPPHPPPGWYIPHDAVYKPARPTLPPPGAYVRRPPPEIRSRAGTWDGVRDGGPNSQRTPFARIWLGDLDLSGCRSVSLCL